MMKRTLSLLLALIMVVGLLPNTLVFAADANDDIYCLEVNTLPGMTSASLLPQEAKAAGIEYADLCELIIEKSLERYNV